MDNIIMIRESDLVQLIERIVEKTGLSAASKKEEWISGDEAMALLGIKSKTTLFNLRVAGKIEYSEISSRNFLYKTESIYGYIESKSQKTF